MAGIGEEENAFWFKKSHYKAFLKFDLGLTNNIQQSPFWGTDDLSVSQYTSHLQSTLKFRQFSTNYQLLLLYYHVVSTSYYLNLFSFKSILILSCCLCLGSLLAPPLCSLIKICYVYFTSNLQDILQKILYLNCNRISPYVTGDTEA
jgi:hypothetical protein